MCRILRSVTTILQQRCKCIFDKITTKKTKLDSILRRRREAFYQHLLCLVDLAEDEVVPGQLEQGVVVTECQDALGDHVIPELRLGEDQQLEEDQGGLDHQQPAHQQARVSKQVEVPDMTEVARLCSVDHSLCPVQVFPMPNNSVPRPETSCGPLVVKIWRNPALHLLPVAEVEGGSV